MDPATAQGLETSLQNKLIAISNLFRKKPKWSESPYAKRLKQISSQGIYDSRARDQILGETYRRSAGAAGLAVENYRQRLANMGMTGSIAGAGKEADILQAAAKPVIESGREMDIENILAKERAKTEYAQQETSFKDKLRAMREADLQALLTGGEGSGQMLAGLTREDAESREQFDKFQLPEIETMIYDYRRGNLSKEDLLDRLERSNLTQEDIISIIKRIEGEY